MNDPESPEPAQSEQLGETVDRILDRTDRSDSGNKSTIGSRSADFSWSSQQSGGQHPSGLTIRCPHCHDSIELSDKASESLDSIHCPACDNQFSLVDSGTSATQTRPTVKQFGHFELIERLGVGAFGSVWKARDTELDRAVAIKIPRKNQLDSEEMELFFREARAAAQLQHPNIVSVHEVGRHDDTVFIVSDLIRGVPLDEWLDAQPITARRSAELCAKLCDAVDHAHQAGVIHRDLKPGNIMLDGNGEPHVMDFGLAKREAGEITMTVEGRVLGTPAYMSPEQASGDGHKADRRTDIYSLGVILYQLLTGELPFRGTPRMLMHQVLNDEPRTLRSLNDRIPRDLETITLKCMQKDADRRYETAGDLGADLMHYLSGDPISARPIGGIERAYRWCGRYPVVAGLSAAILALCLSVATVSTFAAIRIGDSRDRAVAARIEATVAKDRAIIEQKRAYSEEQKALQSSRDEAEQRRRAESAESDARKAAVLAQREADSANEISKFLANMFRASTPIDPSGFILGSTNQADAQLTAREMLDHGAKKALTELADQPAVRADLLETIGGVYLGISSAESAGPLLEETLKIRRARLRPDHPKIASLLFLQGYEKLISGHYADSKLRYGESLKLRRNEFGDHHRIVVETKQALGTGLLLSSRNWLNLDVDESERLLREVIADLDAADRIETIEYGFAALALVGVLTHKPNSDLQQAALLTKAQSVFAANEETKGLSESIALAFGARLQARFGNADRAADLFAQGLAKMKETLGDEHWAVMLLVPHVSEGLTGAGQYDRAMAILNETETTLVESDRTDHPYYAKTIAAQVRLLFHQGKSDEARERGDLLLSCQMDGNLRVVLALRSLGRAHFIADDFDRSYRSFKAAADGYQQVDEQGEHYPAFYSAVLADAGIAARELGQFEESQRLIQQAIQIRKTNLGTEHRKFKALINELTKTIQRAGNPGDDIHSELDETAQQIADEAPDNAQETHPADYARLLAQAGIAARWVKRYEESERLLTDAAEIYQQQSEIDNRLIAWTIREIALTLREQGQIEESIKQMGISGKLFRKAGQRKEAAWNKQEAAKTYDENVEVDYDYLADSDNPFDLGEDRQPDYYGILTKAATAARHLGLEDDAKGLFGLLQ